ncbi:hypothetical protein LEP1GSC131_0465 [Leptospira kirschneri str. 200802841]|uniref:Uncharacterized protein n=1 Tax=Leptospira kirschneri str. 200802841 TaxID=1193047 RepID=A0A828Y7Z3_9LEPT|nr:hypothetical protein LEP1GSC131_0465 [Leptospira kirschneri str. 200802841]
MWELIQFLSQSRSEILICGNSYDHKLFQKLEYTNFFKNDQQFQIKSNF